MTANKTPKLQRHEFEHFVTTTLEQQNNTLDRLEKKLEVPVLNGGFDSMLLKVEKIELIQEQFAADHAKHDAKLDAINAVIYDPDEGIFARIKIALTWIKRANWVIKGTLGLIATGALGGIGKLLYVLLTGHIHYTP